MRQTTGARETFVVSVLNRQNATWQGTITWAEGKQTQSFRSALELIRLIDSTLLERETQGENVPPPEGGGHQKEVPLSFVITP